jgi:hypothetical protein
MVEGPTAAVPSELCGGRFPLRYVFCCGGHRVLGGRRFWEWGRRPTEPLKATRRLAGVPIKTTGRRARGRRGSQPSSPCIGIGLSIASEIWSSLLSS